jgi:hypothetical protein
MLNIDELKEGDLIVDHDFGMIRKYLGRVGDVIVCRYRNGIVAWEPRDYSNWVKLETEKEKWGDVTDQCYLAEMKFDGVSRSVLYHAPNEAVAVDRGYRIEGPLHCGRYNKLQGIRVFRKK